MVNNSTMIFARGDWSETIQDCSQLLGNECRMYYKNDEDHQMTKTSGNHNDLYILTVSGPVSSRG